MECVWVEVQEGEVRSIGLALPLHPGSFRCRRCITCIPALYDASDASYGASLCIDLRGMIEAEAAHRVGGLASLLACLAKGDVLKGTHMGIDLYYFPRVKFAKSQAWGTNSVSSSEIATTSQGHRVLRDMAQNYTWQVDGQLPKMAKAIEEAAEVGLLPEDVAESLGACQKDMASAVKAAERLASSLDMSNSTVFVRNLLRDMTAASEAATTLAGELGFILKFKKMPGRGPLTAAALEAKTVEAAECLSSLQELWRALKGLSAPAEEGKGSGKGK